jgi:hypothetical protein
MEEETGSLKAISGGEGKRAKNDTRQERRTKGEREEISKGRMKD